MTPKTVSKTGTGRSGVIALDWFTNPYNVALQAALSGTATFSVEITLEDPMDSGFDASTAVWTAVTNLSAITASALAQSTIPAKGVSINVASGTGTVTLTVLQAGIR